MKSNLVFFSLASAALLASCQDEAFESVANQTAKEAVKVDFTISGDEATRVIWTTEGTSTLTWEGTEKFSLMNITGQAASTPYAPSCNAVYQKGENDTFTSENIVYIGKHFIKLPAELEYVSPTSPLKVVVPTSKGNVQSADETLGHRTVFLSDKIDITAAGVTVAGKTVNDAGYHKIVNAPIHNISSAFVFNTTISNAPNVELTEPFKLSDVTVSAPTAAFYVDGTVQESTADADKVSFVGGTTNTNIIAKYATPVELKNGQIAISFLPTAGETTDKAYFIVAQTNYGKVAIENAKYVSQTTAGVKKFQGKDGLSTTATVLSFKKEVEALKGDVRNGSRIIRDVEVDLSKLNMDSLHIKTSAQLINALKVYDAVKANQNSNITFFLDGTAGTFTMTAAAADAFVSHCDMTGKTITFTPCQNFTAAEKCNTVVFDNGTAAAKELPAKLVFTKDAACSAGEVDVEFVGAWKSSKKTEKIQDVNKMTVKSTIELSNTTGSKAGKPTNGFVVAKGATATVSGIAYLNTYNYYNFGTINIPTEATELRVYSELTNERTSVNQEADDKILCGDCGVIQNSGVLATVLASTEGKKITNYGVIYKNTPSSKTYITNNGQTPDKFATPFNASSNKLGTIVLNNKNDDNYSVTDGLNLGFIKLVVNQAEISAADLGNEANYIVVGANAQKFNYSLPAGARQKFVEFQNNSEVVWTTTSTNPWDGIVINTGVKVNVKKNNKMYSNVGYIKGILYMGGTYDIAQFKNGYLGGTDADKANVLVY